MSTAEQKAQQAIPWDRAVTDALGMDSDAVHNTRDIARAAYIKGYAAGQEDLPLAMSEEEIEREADKWWGSEEYNRCDSTTEALKVFAIRMLANTRLKSLTVENGRTFTEGEVRAKEEDLKWALNWINNEAKHLRERGEPQEALEVALDMILERHGIVLDPA